MKAPLQLRALTDAETNSLRQGLRSPDAFTLKRCQVLLASERKETVAQISTNLSISLQGVRNIIRAFHREGLTSLSRHSNRPKTGPSSRPILAEQERTKLRQILEQSPRTFGKTSSIWTISLLAPVLHEQGLTDRLLGRETVRIAVKRLGLDWKRAKSHISSPDPAYARKKSVVIS